MKSVHASHAVLSSKAGQVLGAVLLLAFTGGVASAADMNPRIDDIVRVLAQLSPAPQWIPCDAGDFTVPSGGHLQGIQQAKIGGKPFVIVSGSSGNESYLALIALEGDVGHVAAIKPLLARPFKHAGGFQVCGDYLAVGIEDDETRVVSKVWIVALAALLKEPKLEPVIEIPRHGVYERATAGAVAMAKVRERHLVCVGTWDSATIDIYHSNGKALDDPACAFTLRETWDAAQADRSEWSDPDFASYQNLNFVVDKSDQVFLIGFARAGDNDIADVFEFFDDTTVPVERRLQKVRRFIFHGGKTSFQHGSGLAIVSSDTVQVLACGRREFVIERFESGPRQQGFDGRR